MKRLLPLVLLVTGCASYEIVGYQAAWKPPAKLEARELTVVNYAFADICWDGRHGHPVEGGLRPCLGADGSPIVPPNGSIVFDDPPRDRAALAQVAAARGGNPALRILVSIGGWTRSNRFSDMAQDAATRTNFARSAVDIVRSYGLDGIDLDWEYPGTIGVPCAAGHTCQRREDKRDFVLLMAQMRSVLQAASLADGKRYFLTIAAGADDEFLVDADGSRKWLADLAGYVDWINLMSYDYHGSWERVTGFNASIEDVEASVKRLVGNAVPPRKITLGMPFYGKGWSGCSPGSTNGLRQPCAGLATGSSNETFEFSYLTDNRYLTRDEDGDYTRARRGFTRHWDAQARVPYLFDPASGVFITYDDEQSVREKIALVKRLGLRGAMFWELDADRHGVLRRIVSEGLAH